MNDKNEEKAVVSQGKSNKKRRFRPRNKNKQENLDQNAKWRAKSQPKRDR